MHFSPGLKFARQIEQVSSLDCALHLITRVISRISVGDKPLGLAREAARLSIDDTPRKDSMVIVGSETGLTVNPDFSVHGTCMATLFPNW